ncbi:Type I secretion system membrane fusion protein PrsE [Pseudoruegeria aquimaris]|uniref:Membrane fusion protein (MFP) family protein n=1 Tax=Pseudoruegeria aquimaris TaxID=393663 RepID=A0A1Y5TIX1_9RHOB|nr:HlyD family type I secretion periplasmic adaptor subunit [Pseudoruegeria aquimaris]SLN65020.1 Type I secretion system membrane fusion protein PrsE [Pseudoruegeria aquimaris]
MSSEKNKPWSPRGALIVGFIAVFVLVGGFGYWAARSQIAGAIIASGQIQVDQNQQIVQHPDGGVVEEIFVEEGDLVQAGDLLIRLESRELRSDLAVVEGQLYEIMARRARYTAERDGASDVVFDLELVEAAVAQPSVKDVMEGQARLFAARALTLEKEVEQLQKRSAQIQSQINGITAQQTALTRQLELIGEELEDQQELLEKGLAQAPRVLSLQREQARLLGTVGELEAAKAEAEGRITEIEIAVLKLGVQRREEAITQLRNLQFQELELREQRAKLRERLSRLDIRAPVSGVVLSKSVSVKRAVIRPAEPILSLVPQDRPLVISAQVSPIHVDEIYAGQEVFVRFTALDTRNTPELIGRVVRVSPDAFVDETSRQSYYLSEIELLEGETDKLPEGTVLVPGMPVEAYMRTRDRTPMAYLVKPLADYFNRAFRES